MREIKFRAWSNRDKCWCGAFAVHMSGLWRESPNNEWTDLSKQDEIVLLQYTGLKDKNGKEIYEGDMIKVRLADGYGGDGNDENEENTLCIQEVKWSSTGGYFTDEDTGDYCPMLGSDEITTEIIGNIYENPELIK